MKKILKRKGKQRMELKRKGTRDEIKQWKLEKEKEKGTEEGKRRDIDRVLIERENGKNYNNVKG